MANDKDFKVRSGIQPTVYHEAVGTITTATDAYSLSATSYDSVNSGVLSQVLNITGLYFKSDGTKMYTIGTSESRVYQYSLSTAWDASTASYDSVNYSYSSQSTSARGLFFKSDGTKMYIPNNSTNIIYQYSLSTAWDISTASYDNKSANLSTQIGSLHDFTLTSDGTTLFAADVDSEVYQYTLSTAHDISTASYASKTLDTSSEITTFQRFLFVSPDGVTLIAGDYTTLFSYTMSTAKDLSTASYDSVSFDASTQEAQIRAIAFKTDGSKMYLAGQDQSVYQYSSSLTTATLDLSTGSVFEITPTSDIQVDLTNPADSGTVSAATLLLDGAGTTGYDLSTVVDTNADFVSPNPTTWDTSDLDFNSDGTKLYVLFYGERRVRQYSLSTAWDVSTATYDSKEFYINEDTLCNAFTLADNGSKMYVVGRSNDRIYLYNLSTAYDISTASYSNNFISTSGQSANSYGIRVSSDGSRLILSLGSDIVDGSFGTAWLPSTISFNTTQLTNVRYFDVSPDGLTLWALDIATYNVTEYTLGSSYNLTSTLVATGNSVNAQTLMGTTSLHGVRFGDSGKYLYIGSQALEVISRFSSSAPATITYDTSLQFAGGTAPTSPAIGETDVLTFSTRDGGTSYQAALAIDGAK